MTRPTITLDFDGVIHDARDGWRNGEIYGEVSQGFFEWAEKVCPHFYLVVYSARSRHPALLAGMRRWLETQHAVWVAALGRPTVLTANTFMFAEFKVHAALHIDDNGFRFEGDWEHPFLDPSNLLAVRAWNER